jgi:hypothetical protein
MRAGQVFLGPGEHGLEVRVAERATRADEHQRLHGADALQQRLTLQVFEGLLVGTSGHNHGSRVAIASVEVRAAPPRAAQDFLHVRGLPPCEGLQACAIFENRVVAQRGD